MTMDLLISPIPTWKEIINFALKKDEPYWRDEFLTAKSGSSIRLILECLKEVRRIETLYVWLPNYYCGETETELCASWVRIVHYPVLKELDPDWEKIKALSMRFSVDVFVAVHYFGVYHDMNRARIFCTQHKAILIEDCAHVLFKYQKIGQAGDYSVFSAYKFIPVPDGAVLSIRKSDNEINSKVTEMILDKLNEKEVEGKKWGWRCKKIIQKIVRKNKRYVYTSAAQYYEKVQENKHAIKISRYSKDILSSYSYEKLKSIAYVRRENCDILKHIVKSIDENIECIIPDDCVCPYYAVFSLSKVIQKDEVIRKIRQLKIPVLSWPALPLSIKNENDYKRVEELTENIILLPVHQGIKPCDLAGRVKLEARNEAHRFHLSLCSESERNAWENIFNQIPVSNITQHWAYGDVKKQTEGWNVARYLIEKDGGTIGGLQLLYKSFFGRGLIYRLNKGPVFIEGENSVDNEVAVMQLLWKEIQHPCIFLYVPYTPMSARSYITMVGEGWRNWNIYGFPTGTIDLTKSQEDIRKRLDGKWRNQLKAAEKQNYVVKTGDEKFDEMVHLYEAEQGEKRFLGVNSNILKAMQEHRDKPLEIYYIEDDLQKILAFDIFYKHGKAATYYIGWNSEEGRRKYLNNLLLYHATVDLKNQHFVTLDLGGIEYIHTETIAKFKDGMHPTHFRQMGEFLKIG